ncbi:BolA family protein [Iodobacter fluviatilis]|uniref:BolA protein n=1 Tax=Iodobacter fluviatilis TaxID=537 RepID=A0A377Q720_9NEIS|nr:BolA family protein [Iodobacter fluviatilis]TCU89179.1 BolA protein [Iodobacter fluviatilis]STQ90548.1 transcriptional regulator BolA [Iodobacter fluviatilis]
MSSPSVMIVEEIHSRLGVLQPEYVDIDDDSASHAGHAGSVAGGGHYDLTIVSAQFAGKNTLARHRMVMALFVDLIPHPIHALSIKKTLTPDEL